MAEKTHWPDCKGLHKIINNKSFFLGRSWDLTHGRGWFVQVFDENGNIGFGFHKTNKFTAVHMALANLKEL